MGQARRKTFYVYRGSVLVGTYDGYSAEGACSWVAQLKGLPVSELAAQSTSRDALGGC